MPNSREPPQTIRNQILVLTENLIRSEFHHIANAPAATRHDGDWGERAGR
jgi:hypothetical protein